VASDASLELDDEDEEDDETVVDFFSASATIGGYSSQMWI